jgi:hypothetical protein
MFFWLVLSIATFGQKQKHCNKALKIYSPLTTEYPSLSTNIEYHSLTKPFVNDSLVLLEDGIKTKVKSIDLIKTDIRLRLHFILVDIDSNRINEYIKKLALVKRQELDLNLLLFNDSAILLRKPSIWLKNPYKWRGIYDTISFKKLSTNYLRLLHRPDEVVVILTKELSLSRAEKFKNRVQNKANLKPPNLILLFEEAKPSEVDSLNKWANKHDIPIIQFSPEMSDLSSLFPYLSSIQNSQYTITWKSPKPFDLNASRLLQIRMKGNADDLKIVIQDTIIEKLYSTETIKTADSLSYKKDIKACLKLLNNGYGSLKSSVFIDKTKEILIRQLNLLVENKGSISLSSFTDLEAVNNIPLGTDYQQERIKKIKELYNLVNQSDTLRTEQLKISVFLAKAAPEDAENKYFLHLAKAKLYDSKVIKWQALDEYKLAYEIKKDEKARGDITRLISSCLNEAYRTKDWKRLKSYGQSYSDFYKQSFALKYFYANACFELSDYDEAISQFKWLLFNWENNNNISWNDAFNYLQKAYTYSSRFNEAVTLCQRIFIEKKDNKSLELTLLNIRLSWLKPVMDAFNLWLDKIPAEAHPEKTFTLRRVTFPQYIGSVKICDPKGETLSMLFENKTFPKQPVNAPIIDKKITSVQIESNIQWMISGLVGNRAIVMTIDNGKMEEPEKNILLSIKKDPANNQVWNQLFAYEEKIGARLLTQLYAAIISSSIQMNGADVTDRYVDVLKVNKFIQYIAYQKRDGTIGYNSGFDAKMATYKGDEWEKSSKTVSLYFIEMKYKNTEIYEITNPIFNGTVWEGVLRIGIKSN